MWEWLRRLIRQSRAPEPGEPQLQIGRAKTGSLRVAARELRKRAQADDEYRSGTNNPPGPPFLEERHDFWPCPNNYSICCKCGCRMTGHLLVNQGDIEGARRVENRLTILATLSSPTTITGRRPSHPEYQTIPAPVSSLGILSDPLTPVWTPIDISPSPPMESSGVSDSTSSSSDFGGGDSGGGGASGDY